MNAYADSSFLLSLYSVDANSHSAAALVRQHQPVFCLPPLSEAEFTNAVELGVFTKRYTAREARAVRDYFLSHIRSGVFRVHDLPPDAYALARSLSLRHTAKLGTRALDVLHVASALIRGSGFGVRGSQNKSPNPDLPLRIPSPESRTPLVGTR